LNSLRIPNQNTLDSRIEIMKYKDFLSYSFPLSEVIVLNERLHRYLREAGVGYDLERIKRIPSSNSILFCTPQEILEGGLFEEIANRPFRYLLILKKFSTPRFELWMDRLPSNVFGVYATHANFQHPKLHSLPLGIPTIFRDALFQTLKESPAQSNRKLIYCNFSLYTNPEKRGKVLAQLKNKNWLDPTMVRTSDKKETLSLLDYFRLVTQHKFVVSPEGRGVDAHRTWETLWLKTIPIVQKSIHMDNFTDLPILFTEDFSELSPEYLNDKYQEMLETDYNIEKLKASFWLNEIVDFFEKEVGSSPRFEMVPSDFLKRKGISCFLEKTFKPSKRFK